MIQKKCKECPYHLGLIKCISDPCPSCRKRKDKSNPFPKPIIKEKA